MDSFSGRFPLEFISFYLDMLSEEHNEIVPATATGTLIEEVPQRHEETAVSQATATLKDAESKQPEPPKDNSAKPDPTSSPSTDESISAYIERQLQTLGCQGTGLDISFLPEVPKVVLESKKNQKKTTFKNKYAHNLRRKLNIKKTGSSTAVRLFHVFHSCVY